MLIDAINNRPIVDGNSVFLGDQVIIDIKTIKKGSLNVNNLFYSNKCLIFD